MQVERKRNETKKKKIAFLSLELKRVPQSERFAEGSAIDTDCNHICLFWISKLVFQQAFEELDSDDTLTDK